MNNVDVSTYKTGPSTTFRRLSIFSIANQLSFGVVSLLVVALLVMAGSMIYLSFQTQQQHLRTIQEERAKDAAAKINAYMDDLQRKLGYLARVRGLTEMSLEVQANLLEGLARHNTAYETLTILDSAGQTVQQVSSYGRPLVPSLDDSHAFSRAFNLNEDFVSAVELDRATNLPYVVLAVPIRDQADEVDGVLLAVVNLRFLWFITSQVRVGESGYAYVVDRRGFLIAKQGSLPKNFQLDELSIGFIDQDFESDNVERGATYQGLEGMQVLGASASVRTPRWTVVVELPTAEAYAPTRTMLFVMSIVVTVAAAVSVGLGILLSRSISRRLIKLRDAAFRLGEGELGSRVDIESKDEIGDLATTFNLMAGDLQNTFNERKQFQEQLLHSQKLEAVGHLAAGVAHELNNPLGAIVGYADIVLEQGNLDESSKVQVTRILKRAEQAAKIVRQLRGFVQPSEIHDGKVDVGQVIEESIEMVAQQMALQGVSVAVHLDPQKGSTWADSDSLQQVFLNLALNAKDAMPSGGKLLIQTARVTLDDDYARRNPDASAGEHIVISVSDTGTGMTPEVMSRVFEPFFTTKEVGKGTGLGLSMCYGIVAQSGGHITVQSEPASGTTFNIYLPCVDE